ncbi:MAG: ATP-binding protein [Gemmatimonadota bacterium]
MSLPPIAGHEALRERFRSAVAAGRFPQSLLLHGPAGVGKQRLALWAAALLQCGEEGRPCGRCRSCRLADGLEHPDIHWYFPLPRPKGNLSDPKLRARLEEARFEELAARRADPMRAASWEEVSGIYLAAVDRIRSAAIRRPAIGSCSVFVVGDAERMVPQAGSPEAANAFLKLLEEPPPDTFLLLTSSRPAALLPTIHSRVLAVRVPPLTEGEVAAFLRERAGIAAQEAERLARLTGGSIGQALRRATESEADPTPTAMAFLRAALSSRRADRLGVALSLAPSGARGEFSAALGALSEILRDLLRAAEGGNGLPEDLRGLVQRRRLSPQALLAAFGRLEEALAAAQGNVNPQAIATVLLSDMAAAFGGGGNNGDRAG